MAPTEVTFSLSRRYGIDTALEPMPFWSETVRRVVVVVDRLRFAPLLTQQ